MLPLQNPSQRLPVLKVPAAQIRDLGALRWLHAGESVILFGPVGVGKTHIAQALSHLAIRQGAHVRFAKNQPHPRRPRRRSRGRTWEKRIRKLVRPDVLIIDDFSMRQLTAAHQQQPGAQRLVSPLPQPRRRRVPSGLNATSHQVIMDGPSYRPNKRPRNCTDKTSIK